MSPIEKALSELHSEMAKQLLADLKDPAKRGPGLYEAIRRFLADNDITALPIAGSALGDLKDEAQKSDSLPFPSAQRTGTNS